MSLFQSSPLSEKEMQLMTEQYNGSYNHWVGALLHIADKSRWDLSYMAMRLSGYNNCPSKVCYDILYQGMCYLYHHPLVPIMYPSQTVNKQDMTLQAKFGRGQSEIRTTQKMLQSGMEAWGDADLARGILDRRSTTSCIHKWGEVCFSSQCVKQPEVAASTNDAEVRALFQTTKRTLLYRAVLASLGLPQPEPTVTHEDNAATIAQVIKDRLTPRVKHMGTLIGWLNEQVSRLRMKPTPCSSENMDADMNTKPYGGFRLQDKFLSLIGHQFYPPPTSEHFKLLELGKYNINPHRGSFILNKDRAKQVENPTQPTD